MKDYYDFWKHFNSDTEIKYLVSYDDFVTNVNWDKEPYYQNYIAKRNIRIAKHNFLLEFEFILKPLIKFIEKFVK